MPAQDKANVHFLMMNFQIGAGKRANRSYGYELEALFCDNRLLFVAENSGLWTRTEWAHSFNIPGFVPGDACEFHPYWQTDQGDV